MGATLHPLPWLPPSERSWRRRRRCVPDTSRRRSQCVGVDAPASVVGNPLSLSRSACDRASVARRDRATAQAATPAGRPVARRGAPPARVHAGDPRADRAASLRHGHATDGGRAPAGQGSRPCATRDYGALRQGRPRPHDDASHGTAARTRDAACLREGALARRSYSRRMRRRVADGARAKVPDGGRQLGMVLGIPRIRCFARSAQWRRAAPSHPRGHAWPGPAFGSAYRGDRQASVGAYAAPRVRHTPHRVGIRHPDGAGIAGTPGRVHDDDLLARAQPWRARCREPARSRASGPLTATTVRPPPQRCRSGRSPA